MQDDMKKSGFISGQNFFLAVLFLSGTALTVEIALQVFGGMSLCGVSDCKLVVFFVGIFCGTLSVGYILAICGFGKSVWQCSF